MDERKYDISFRCHFGGEFDNYTQHRATITLAEIAKWIEAYTFTHPNVRSISAKWWNAKEGEER